MKELEQLIKFLARMPGLGPRSARRFALQLVKKPESCLTPLINHLVQLADTMCVCGVCGNIDNSSPCHICQDTTRERHQLCIVEEVVDLWALERAGGYRGYYHILGGCLSALDGIGPEQLNIEGLMRRLYNHQNDNHGNDRQDATQQANITELILATNLTVDGQTTAHYISDLVTDMPINITRLAHGVPLGGELDYLDDGTLRAALHARKKLS